MTNDVNASPFAQSLGGLWAGTEAGLAQYVIKMANMRANMSAFMDPDRKAPAMSGLLSVQNGVGVIEIKGPLASEGTMLDALFGVTSYPAIRQALVQAASSPDIKSIMLDIGSPGGQVSGVADTAELIKQVDAVKPVFAHTSNDMASAAYWLGSSARNISASKTSMVGSIGTIYTHKEVSKALEKEGITVNVLREGEFKSLASPYEPLSDTARAGLQSEMKAVNSVFVNHVAESRGKSVPVVDATMGQGRVFVGQAAMDVGLVDSIQSFDQAMAAATRAANAASAPAQNKTTPSLSRNGMTQALTEQQLAMKALGVVEKTADELAAETAVAEALVAKEAAETAAAAAEVEKAAQLAAANEPAALQATVASLTSAMAAKDKQMLDLAVAKQIAEDKLATLQASVDPLKAIAEKSLRTMQVALNIAPVDMARTAEALLAEHAAVETPFKKRFKAGGVAAVGLPDSKDDAATVVPFHKQRISAVGLNKKEM